MAYQVGQLRKDTSQTYMTSLAIDKTIQYPSINPFSFQNDENENRYFEDFALRLEDQSSFKPDEVYFLRFKILRIPQFFYSSDTNYGLYMGTYSDADSLNLTIELRQYNAETQTMGQNYQTIGTCSIPQIELFSQKSIKNGENYDYIASQYLNKTGKNPYASFSFVFSPDSDLDSETETYNTIVFRIQRISYDVLENPCIPQQENNEIIQTRTRDGRTWLRDWKVFEDYNNYTYERNNQSNNDICKYLIDLPTVVVENELSNYYEDPLTPAETGELSILSNIIPNQQKWIKIGYQCRPGSLIIINKQPIRVGKSGIFELDNNLPIKDFRIANPGGSNLKYIDAFLLDYAYAITQTLGG